MPFIKFESFFSLAKFFYNTIGVEPYERAENTRRSYIMDVYCFCIILNLNLVLISELVYVYLALKNKNHFVEATMNLSFISFVIVGDIKIFNIWYRKQNLTKIICDLNEIYPHSTARQSKYEVASFLRSCNLITFAFAFLHQILVWTFNLFAIVSHLIYDYWLQLRVVPRAFPYYCSVPWNWQEHWSYYLLYASQNFAGYTCVAGQTASDILLCAIVTQVLMHFRYLAKRIGEQTAEHVKCDRDNMEFLRQLVDYHNKILNLSDAINEVFGVSLLVNFFSSSFIMCFLGFQLTIGVDTTVLVMLLFFLFCSLVQVYMICNYAQDLIIASESVGHAVYNHDWHDADLRYKKMLVLIIKRAQEPSILKATTFLNISLGTMTDLMQLSYKFFALLRTMYSK